MRVVRISLLLLALVALVIWQVQSPVATQAAESPTINERHHHLTVDQTYYEVDWLAMAFASRESAVMAALSLPIEDERAIFGTANEVDTALQARLSPQPIISAKISNSNPRVLLACLPSLNRLRGRVSTRWYAPSDCPAGHR